MKLLRRIKRTGIQGTKNILKRQLQINKTKQEEINQKILVKEWRLKRYLDRVRQYKQNRTFQNYEKKKSTSNLLDMAQRQIINQMQWKQNNFGIKYGNGKTITKMMNG